MQEITKKYDRFMVDFVNLSQYSEDNDGYKWMLNVMDSYSKYAWSFKLKEKSAEAIKDSLKQVFRMFGVPRSIQFDNGREFKNACLSQYLHSLKILPIHGKPKNPRALGQMKRLNQTLKRRLYKMFHGRGSYRWIDIHDDIVYTYNITEHNATGKSPMKLFLGNDGFNAELLPAYIEAERDEDEETNAEEPTYPQWDLSEMIRSSESTNEVGEQDEEDAPCCSWQGLRKPDERMTDDMEVQVRRHFNKYKKRASRNVDSNTSKKTLNVGDIVFIRKYFDKNPKTRRHTFESPFQGTFTVSKILGNNKVEVRDQNGESMVVPKTVIKKV